jgi:2-iminobutanoate/2-iminopropanoate deaminase
MTNTIGTAENPLIKSINPAKGPKIPGISAGMVADSGKLLFLSGHVPLDGDNKLSGSDLPSQLKQVFENMDLTLKEAGASFKDVARVTIYVANLAPDMIGSIRMERDKWINLERPPASTVLGVQAFYRPDILVEVEAVAVLPRTELT